MEPVRREPDLSVSAYNARHRRPKSARRQRDEQLIEHIHHIHDASGETYGARRIHRQPRREGITAARCTIERLMREAHSLKRRAVCATRPVPIPPAFVRTLRAHLNRSDVARDGRLFLNQAGNYVDAAAWTSGSASVHDVPEGCTGGLVRDWSGSTGQEGAVMGGMGSRRAGRTGQRVGCAKGA
ncbi:IS3 family transposase [Streptomyces fagopyri]|uniref:IS3 family transposase n=1 Tax=Streptomyces fagopyri TaxID=2662397 RepID=UPI00368A6CD9